jgi:hypothetical protein
MKQWKREREWWVRLGSVWVGWVMVRSNRFIRG